MARKKQHKRDADIFHRTFGGAFQQISGAGLTIAAVLIGLLLVIALLWGFSTSQEEDRQRDWEKIGEVVDEADPRKQRERMAEVVGEVKTSEARAMALFISANLHRDHAVLPSIGKIERAELREKSRRRYEEFLKEYPKHRMAPEARGRLARVMEDSDLLDDAYKAFAEAATACEDTDFAMMQGSLLYGQARCAKELGRPEEALRLLERALAKDPRAGTGGWRLAAEHLRNTLRKSSKSLIVQGAQSDEPPEDEKKQPEKTGGQKPEKGAEKPKGASKAGSGAKG